MMLMLYMMIIQKNRCFSLYHILSIYFKGLIFSNVSPIIGTLLNGLSLPASLPVVIFAPVTLAPVTLAPVTLAPVIAELALPLDDDVAGCCVFEFCSCFVISAPLISAPVMLSPFISAAVNVSLFTLPAVILPAFNSPFVMLPPV